MTVMTKSGREAVSGALSPEPAPDVSPGTLVHVCPTDRSTLDHDRRPCRPATAWAEPTAKAGLRVTFPGGGAPSMVAFFPGVYVRHPSGVRGGQPGAPREPLSTWHLPSACPFGSDR